jgi:hypothetical protein
MEVVEEPTSKEPVLEEVKVVFLLIDLLNPLLSSSTILRIISDQLLKWVIPIK